MLRKILIGCAISFVLLSVFLFAVWPFFHDGFFPTMDDVQVVRIDEMSRELASGQFPVRYVDNLGNGGGYMLFHFYAPFVYYLGAFYHILGFPLVAATKLVFLTGYFIGTLGIIVLLKRYTDWVTTAIGAVLFLTSTYLAYDVYTRGALAEFFALCLLPWLFWSFLRLKDIPLLPSLFREEGGTKNTVIARSESFSEVEGKRRGNPQRFQYGLLKQILDSLRQLTDSARTTREKLDIRVTTQDDRWWSSYIVVAGFFYGLLIVTHNITSFTASIFLLLLFLLPPYSWLIARRFAVAGAIGLGLSAFFWLPVLLEQKYTILSSVDFVTEQYKSNFLNPLQIGGIQKIPWGFKPPLLGIGLFLGLIGSTILYFSSASGMNRRRRELLSDKFGVSSSRLSRASFARTIFDNPVYFFSIVGSILSLILIWSISRPLWDVLPYMRFMQFPWRYLSILTVFSVLSIALFLQHIRRFWLRVLLGILLIIPSVTLYHSYLRPTTYTFIGKYYAEDRCRSTSWAQEQLPRWVIACLPKNHTLPIVEPMSTGLSITSLQVANNGRSIKLTTQGSGLLLIRKYFYPAWKATVDERHAPVQTEGIHGLMRIAVPPGTHRVHVQLQSLPLWRFGNLISVLTALSLLLFFLVVMIRFCTIHIRMKRV